MVYCAGKLIEIKLKHCPFYFKLFYESNRPHFLAMVLPTWDVGRTREKPVNHSPNSRVLPTSQVGKPIARKCGVLLK